MKNILITGANGQLGNEMRLLAEVNKEYTYFFTDVAELDICDEQAVMNFVTDHQIDIIVNCAAYTAVDKAEDDRELCDKLNHFAPDIWQRLFKAVEDIWYRFLPIMFSMVLRIFLIRKNRLLVLTLFMERLNLPVNRRL